MMICLWIIDDGHEHLFKNFPVCDKSLPVMSRNTITSTATMQMYVTTTPRQHNFTTSSSEQRPVEDQKPPCPECEKMYVIYQYQ